MTMNAEARRIRTIYLVLSQFIWLPTSLIVGINTLFLLDGGLSNVEAFAANAIYTLGLVLFEIPTGMVADTWGRKTSYLLGAGVQLVGNLLYFWMWHTKGPFWGWAAASLLLGFGYTFFSGALDAWLVDALEHAGYKGDLDPIFAKNQIATGVAMLVGTIAGGFIAQVATLGTPYLVRASVQLVSFIVAIAVMRDIGFKPERAAGVAQQIKRLAAAGWKYGIKNRPVRWVLLAAPFYLGTGIYGFYAAQPYLLDLFGNHEAIGVAGIAAAGIAATQVAGGFAVPYVRKIFPRRTHILIACAVLTIVSLVLIGLIHVFAVARGHAGPAGVHQRADSIARAGDGAVVRFHGRIDGRRGVSADPRPRRRYRRLPGLVSRVRSDRRDQLAVSFARTPRKHERRLGVVMTSACTRS